MILLASVTAAVGSVDTNSSSGSYRDASPFVGGPTPLDPQELENYGGRAASLSAELDTMDAGQAVTAKEVLAPIEVVVALAAFVLIVVAVGTA